MTINLSSCVDISWQFVALTIACSLIEAWLGKTDKVKAASILELIWNVIKTVLRKH
jgi:hypothetical protein